MQVDVASAHDGTLLEGIRRGLRGADRSLLCVAFTSDAGINLLGKELRQLGPRARLMVTTAFGSTSQGGLATAQQWGVQVRVRNPSGGTYHPKLYASQHGDQTTAVIGSANLTGGLVCNVELATILRGPADDTVLARVQAWGEAEWERGQPFDATIAPPAPPPLEADLHALIEAALARDPILRTLATGAQNEVTAISADGLHVHTARTRTRGEGAQLVPGWMIRLAWDYLQAHGALDNRKLLNDLRVHRSSAVLALLARLPGVEATQGTLIGVRLHGRGVPPSHP
jgi:hypothetical protein